MRRVIRKDGLFLTQEGCWTSDFRLALHFEMSSVAINQAIKLKLKEIELVLLHDDGPVPRIDVAIPLEMKIRED